MVESLGITHLRRGLFFYHRIANLKLIRKNGVQSVIDDIKECINTELTYFRWDKKSLVIVTIMVKYK